MPALPFLVFCLLLTCPAWYTERYLCTSKILLTVLLCSLYTSLCCLPCSLFLPCSAACADGRLRFPLLCRILLTCCLSHVPLDNLDSRLLCVLRAQWLEHVYFLFPPLLDCPVRQIKFVPRTNRVERARIKAVLLGRMACTQRQPITTTSS